jgi:lipoprotein-anchoring transpeptidase ErfK/SrfK
MRLAFVLVLLVFATADASAAERLDLGTVNEAGLTSPNAAEGKLEAVVIKAQILLDRARFSPGEIDGKAGENFKKALVAFEAEQGSDPTGQLSEDIWQKLTATSSDPVLEKYTLSEDDVRGPFVKKIPKKMEDMKDLPSLGYTSSQEQLAEKFHMSEELLAALNPGEHFDTAGHAVVVASKVASGLPVKASRLEVDKTRQTVKVYDRGNKLLAVYPATVGSTEKPAPTGRLKVKAISKNPTYRYNPDYEFKGVHSTRPFTIKPGPNNPVGVVWIGLSPGEGFGIHGTPEPSKVSKSESHGCVRLTNWDALMLASSLSKGAVVDFYGDEQARQSERTAPPRRRVKR